MAIQYSGGPNVNTTFTCTTGTRREIVDGISAALVSAGWTIISGSGTGTQLLESDTTPSPQSLVCRVQLHDPGSGNCAQIKFRNAGNTKAHSNGMFLWPEVGKVFRVIANPYQFFCFTSSSANTGREFCCGGVPYLPSFLQGVITECIWCHGTAHSDTDTTIRATFRTHMMTCSQYYATHANLWNTVNGNQYENPGQDQNQYITGYQMLLIQQGAKTSQTNAYRWHDDSLLVYEPLIGWGLLSASDENKIRGQLWDAAIVSYGFAADVTTSFDTQNWFNVTVSNNGTGGQFGIGSLFLVVP